MIKNALIAFSYLLIACPLFAETNGEGDNYVITADRIKTKTKKTGSSITVIKREDIQNSKKNYVQEILREVEGLDVVQSGASGGNTAIFMRGTNSEHTLLLIDGIEANNPVSTNRSFNFANLRLENVERIEIVRGPQSTLYGSDAIGGVINIITRKGKGSPKASILTEAGSYRTFNEVVTADGSEGSTNFSFSASREDSGNISSAGVKYGNEENDTYQNTGLSGRLGFDISDSMEVNFIARRQSARADLDNDGGIFGDDPNRILENVTSFLRSELVADTFESRIKHTVGLSYTRHDLEDDNDPDANHPLDWLRSNYTGNHLKFDFQNNVIVTEENTLVAGFETEEERAHSVYRSESSFGPFEDILGEKDARTNGYYLQDQHNFGDILSVTFGGRIDDHSIFGTAETWRVSPSLYLKDFGTRLRGAYGTGFKAPSLSQLYSQYGNLELDAEESEGWDIGLEQELFSEDYVLGVTYFQNSIDNLITFDTESFIFMNIAEAETSGFEVFLSAKMAENLDGRINYTYTDSADETTGLQLLRRARNKANVILSYRVSSKLSLNSNLRLVGKRDDNNFSTFPAERVRLGSYSVLDLNLAYDVAKDIQIYLRANNIFDKEYEDVYGFGTLGAAYYAGVKVSI